MEIAIKTTTEVGSSTIRAFLYEPEDVANMFTQYLKNLDIVVDTFSLEGSLATTVTGPPTILLGPTSSPASSPVSTTDTNNIVAIAVGSSVGVFILAISVYFAFVRDTSQKKNGMRFV